MDRNNNANVNAAPAPANGITAAHLRRTLGSGPVSRPGSLYGDIGAKDHLFNAAAIPGRMIDTSIGFSSNRTPPLGSAIDANNPILANLGGNSLKQSRSPSMARPSAMSEHPRSSYSDERAAPQLPGQATTPPPALPTELLDALARDPEEHAAFLAAQNVAKSMPAALPALAPSSPFIVQADESWGRSSAENDGSSFEAQSHRPVQRKKGFLIPNAGLTHFPAVPAGGGFIGTEYLRVTSEQSGSSPRLRKAASAESLRRRAKSSAAADLLQTDANSQPPSGTLLSPDKNKHKKDAPNEIKALWKSLSSKMNGGKGKYRETNDNGTSRNAPAKALTVGRTSMDASRRSLSAYPRYSSDHRASTSSTSFGSLHDIPESSRIPISSTGMVKSQSGPDMYGIASSVPLASVPLSHRSRSAGPSAAVDHETSLPSTVRRRSGLGLEHQHLSDEAEDGWIGYESFTHDLTQRCRTGACAGKTAMSKPSMARMKRQSGSGGGRTTPRPDIVGKDRDEEDDEISDSETEEKSEVDSRLSYISPRDLPLDDVEAQEPLLSDAQASEGLTVQRGGTVRRVSSPLLTPTAATGPSTLERNRKNSSRVRYPGVINTAPASRQGSPQHSPVSSAPIDRVASDGPRSPAVPRGFPANGSGTKRTSETADSGTGMLTPTSPGQMRTPTGLVHPHGLRQRAYSESAASAHSIPVLSGTSSGTTSPRIAAGSTSRSREPSVQRSGSTETEVAMPIIRSRSGSSSNLLRELAAPRKSSADFVIAVVGPKKVGKSTIVEKNLKQSKEKSTILYEDESNNRVVSYVGAFSVCGVSRTIEILEADMDILKQTNEGLLWPKYLPKLDGAMICYKQGDPRALDDLTMLLQGFWTRGGVALIALATHCQPADMGTPAQATGSKTEGDRAAEICNIHGAGLVHLDGGVEDPNRKAKNSLQWILRKVLDARATSETRSPSRTKRSTRADKNGILSTKPSLAAFMPLQTTSEVDLNASKPDLPALSTSHTAITGIVESEESPSSLASKSHLKFGQLDIYLGRDALIQKFLFAAVTGNDDQHVSIFLIVYRRFARPYDVLEALIKRSELLMSHLQTDPLLSRFAQMKLCNILTRWFELYPGDFSGPATQFRLVRFVDGLFTSNWVHQYAVELLHLVKHLSRFSDLESAWALPDRIHLPQDTSDSNQLEAVLPERRPSLVPSLTSTYSSTSPAPSVVTTPIYENTPLTPTLSADMQSHQSGSKSALSLSQRGRSYSDAGTNASSEVSHGAQSAPSLASRESTRRHATLIEASNLVCETSVDKLAQQITRLAWDIFAHMTPRDLLRYVLAPRDPKNPGAPPIRNENNPVSKAIAFFNMLADWTATVVMVQAKRHRRVRTIEHLICLAIALRELDNYDCLMAVLVGLNSQPIHRLDEMETHVSAELVKKFKSLNRLMANTRSFNAYRLAVAVARPDMIPYLGAHLQDVTHLNDAKSDMRDGLVNWSKMKAIGKHCAIVIDCGRLAPQYPVDYSLSRLITSLPIYALDDAEPGPDMLYDLSYQYLPRGQRVASASTGTKLRKLLKTTLQPGAP